MSANRQLVPDFSAAFADLKELKTLALLTETDLSESFDKLGDAGTPLLRVDVDYSLAGTTGEVIARYHLADELLVHLRALRARQGHVIGARFGGDEVSLRQVEGHAA
jgi:hypothetical protein